MDLTNRSIYDRCIKNVMKIVLSPIRPRKNTAFIVYIHSTKGITNSDSTAIDMICAKVKVIMIELYEGLFLVVIPEYFMYLYIITYLAALVYILPVNAIKLNWIKVEAMSGHLG